MDTLSRFETYLRASRGKTDFPEESCRTAAGEDGPLRRARAAPAGTSPACALSRAWRCAEPGPVLRVLGFQCVLFRYVVSSFRASSPPPGRPCGTARGSQVSPLCKHRRIRWALSRLKARQSWGEGGSAGSTSCQVGFADWEGYSLDPETIAPWFLSLSSGSYGFA